LRGISPRTHITFARVHRRRFRHRFLNGVPHARLRSRAITILTR